MSLYEDKKFNSLLEEDSLYKAQGGKAAYQISPTYGQNTLYKVNPVHDAWDRALAAESICQDILSSARNQLYLNMRFMDCALSALFFQGDMGVHPVGTDGTVLYYQPEELMDISSQPITLHFTPLFSREGRRMKSSCGCPVLESCM